MLEKINAKAKLTTMDYFHFYIYSYYHKAIGVVVTIIGIIFLVFSLLDIKNLADTAGIFNQLLSPLIFIFGTPILLLLKSLLAFNTNSSTKETTTFIFDEEILEITNDSYELKVIWEKMNKVIELSNIFLFYTSRNAANILPKRSLTSDEIVRIREFVRIIPELSTKLKA